MTTQEMMKTKIPKGFIMWNYGPFNGKPNWKLRKIDDTLRSFQIAESMKKPYGNIRL